MQHEEDICSSDSDSVLGRVRDIRRKWAVQEDEALAYKLQDEEIAQHYSSNRTRNAIVREDAPRAREAQRQEELEALEERLRHLGVLKKQAEEDARLAKLLASSDAETAKAKRHSRSSAEDKPSPEELFQQVTKEVLVSSLNRTKSPLLGSGQPIVSDEEPGPSRSCLKNPVEYKRLSDDCEEDVRKIQEERDEVLARTLQEELDRYERDKLLAVEAQDRELAKMIHEKEKARLRRAKEKARLKAEAAAAAASDNGEALEGECEGRTASRNSSVSERSKSGEMVLPPKLPEKLKNPHGDQIGFRANPKPLPVLPPHPSENGRSSSASPQSRLEHHRLPVEPVPPYMPIHGYHRSNSKRK